jgi:isoleucyl-tRNA synthetase
VAIRPGGLPAFGLESVVESGRFTVEAPDWLTGQQIFAANHDDRARLRGDGPPAPAGSYPHCWRCKKPVIFRATEQWFIAVDRDDLRRADARAVPGPLAPDGARPDRAMVSPGPTGASAGAMAGRPVPAAGCLTCHTQLLTAGPVRLSATCSAGG